MSKIVYFIDKFNANCWIYKENALVIERYLSCPAFYINLFKFS